MRTQLFGVISGPDIDVSKHEPHVDGFELRLDHFSHIDLNELKSLILKCKKPVMLTVRRNDQGGSFLGSEEERLKLLESLCKLEPAYIDLEYDVPADYRKRLFEAYPKTAFLSSYHDFTGMPADLEAIYQKVKTPHAHIYKIAVTAQSTLDALKMLTFVQKHSSSDKIIGIAMGEEGKPTRILAPVVGSYLTYAILNHASAPGQLSAQELQETYHFSTLDRQTQIYSLIGDPIEKSMGALIHNAVFHTHKLNAVYIKMRLAKEEVPAFFSLIGSLPFKGFSVTMPLKELVMPHLTQASIDSRVMGACNTIKIDSTEIIGYTTDGVGALNPIERRMIVYGKHVVVVGAGGSAKSVILEAVHRGAYVTVINRTAEKAIEIAKALGGRGGGWELFSEVYERGYDVIINCTPESDVIDEKWIVPEAIAMDIIYIPKMTPFLKKAAQKKCRLVYGYEMFVSQAIEQERIWFPSAIDFDKAYAMIEEIVVSALKE